MHPSHQWSAPAPRSTLERRYFLVVRVAVACRWDTYTMPGLDDLPRNLLGLVAYHLVVDDHGVGGDPSMLASFLLTSRSIHSALMFDEYPQLYYDLYCATFDHAALQRRFDWMAKTMAAAGAGGGAAKPGGGNGKEGGGPPGPGGGGKKMFKLFDDPRSWAIDYRARWEMARRMKKVVRYGSLFVPGFCDRETVLGDLWNMWFLLTENGESSSLPSRPRPGVPARVSRTSV